MRLGTGIVIAALRGGAVLARTAATLDLISGGRLDLGVGTGWQEREYEAAGLDFADRGPLLDDTLAACRALWAGGPASVSTPGLSFDDAYCSPRPAPGRSIPIMGANLRSRRLCTVGSGGGIRSRGSHMTRPDVTLENYEDVYRFYLDHQQNRLVANAAYAALSARFRPRTRYADGACRQLQELLGSGTRLIVAANHVTDRDQYTLAATAWQSPLRRAIGRTRVLAKDELFVDPKLRRKIDMMGSIPVFRGKDHGMRAVADAGRRMMEISAQRLHRGDVLAIFPEGTCNDVDPSRVQKINSGIGHIAVKARKLGSAPALLSLGIRYRPGGVADVYISSPVLDLPTTPMDITRVVAADMQAAVDGAFDTVDGQRTPSR
ncbi:acyltransferase-like protein [Rhodococcus sp. AG1013]|nr:acyltransferase-like protein [Rhodococcus sp. AG1013]